MSARKLRCVVIALVLSGFALLLPAAPAYAVNLSSRGQDGARGQEGILRQVRERNFLDALALLIRKIVTPSGGGMDPNGIG